MKSIQSACNIVKVNFTESDQQRICFYKDTGIETNLEAISKYIHFKEQLGQGITWQQMKEIQQYLDLSGNEIKINLSKAQKQYSDFTVMCFLISVLCGVWLAGHQAQYTIHWLSNSLKAQLLFLVPVFMGYLLIAYTSYSLIVAKMIERRIVKKTLLRSQNSK